MTDNGPQYDALEPIAIVGMACRVPGADDIGEFWHNLISGIESIERGTLEEHAALGVPRSDLEDPDFVPVKAVLRDADALDAAMFDLIPAEAELRDPQHRLFLELSYTALEDAGCDPTRYSGAIGVYAGSGEDSYQWHHVRRNEKAAARAGAVGMSVNSHPDYVSTFTSYKLDLRGPSLTVHTACSTSLVAVHLACEALRNGECEMAIAGGVNLEFPLGHGYVYADGSVYSRDGRCRPFDAEANGTVWSSGGAVLVLKPLSAARADGDEIRAMIIGNAVNNDGSAKAGFTAPSAPGQAAVVAQALSTADVRARSIGFVEAHGTGTSLGDPLEVTALNSVYRKSSADAGWCALGSVKSNIGHLGPAAGATGLIKAVLAVQNGVIPSTLNFENANPEIDFDDSPFFVNTSPIVWSAENGDPRRAAVSSFGMGGTNAHVVIEQAPAVEHEAYGAGPYLLRLSARTETALEKSAARLADHLASASAKGQADLASVAATLSGGRRCLTERLAVVAADHADAVAALRNRRRWTLGSAPATQPRVVFTYPGQGSQYPGMGADLYAEQEVYRDAVDACCDVLPVRIAETVRAALSGTEIPAETMDRTEIAQPALFVVEFALAQLWASWGVRPAASIGHSIGEFVAATCAGVFSLADALTVVAERGRLMQDLEPGAMLAVQLGEAAVREILPTQLDVCAVNGRDSCVVGGPVADVEAFAQSLKPKKVSARRLRTSHAFHSRMMDPAVAAFREVLSRCSFAEPTDPFVSSVTGTWITPGEATDPGYWARHMREPVRFGAGIGTVAELGRAVFVECGPGRQLSSLVGMHRDPNARTVQCLPTTDETTTATQKAAVAAAMLWVSGVENSAFAGPAAKVALPTYPWERTRHWVDPDSMDTEQSREQPQPWPAVRHAANERFAVPVWRQRITPAADEAASAEVMLLGDDPANLAARLAAHGRNVLAHRVPSARQEDFEALFKQFERDGALPRHIVYLSATLSSPAGNALEAWDAVSTGFFGLVGLVRALSALEPQERIVVDVVTRGTQHVIGSDVHLPENATVAGAVKVLPLEYPWLEMRHFDLDAAATGRALGAETARLAAELCAAVLNDPLNSAEPLIAVRGERSWERNFQDVRVSEHMRGSAGTAIRQHGVYLITGGLGGIGLTLAEQLATQFEARLVLLSRSAPNETRAETVAAVSRMREAGAVIKTVTADVSDAAALTALRCEILAEFGRLDGIVHAAGVAGGGLVELRDRAAMEEVLRPKILGTLALHEAFGDLPLDFVVLCSSVTAISGAVGQADYCAANAFLDAFAAATQWDAAVCSVNWGGWSQIGMAARADGSATPTTASRRAEDSGIEVRANLIDTRSAQSTDGECWAAVELRPERHWPLADHRIEGVPVLPGTGQIEMIRSAFEALYDAPSPRHRLELRDVAFLGRLAVPDGTGLPLRIQFTAGEGGVEFAAADDSGGQVYARGTAAWIEPAAAIVADLAALRARCGKSERHPAGRELSKTALVEFGPHWGALQSVYEGEGEQLAALVGVAGAVPDAEEWVLQPALLDEALATGWQYHDEYRYLPFGYGRMLVRAALPARVWSHVQVRPSMSRDVAIADVTVYDESGTPIVEVEDFVMRRVNQAWGAPEVAHSAESGTPARLTPAEGAAAFLQLLEADLGAQCVISAVAVEDLVVRARQAKLRLEDPRSGSAPSTADPDPGKLVRDANSRTEAEQGIAEIWGEILGLEADTIGLDTDFFEAGGNSLVAVQLIAMLRRRFGTRLPMRRFFADPTVSGLARTIDDVRASTAAVGHAS